MVVKLFANYGVLAHEKEVIYKQNPISSVADVVDVIIPESMKPIENNAGEIIVELSGNRYILDWVLSNINGTPTVSWCDGVNYRTCKLETV